MRIMIAQSEWGVQGFDTIKMLTDVDPPQIANRGSLI